MPIEGRWRNCHSSGASSTPLTTRSDALFELVVVPRNPFAQRCLHESFDQAQVSRAAGPYPPVPGLGRQPETGTEVRGGPWRLPLAEGVLLVAVHYRTNLTVR